MGIAVALGCAVGVVSFFWGGVAIALVNGVEWSSAVGLGLFVAVWGGLGFGSMVGGVAYLSRLQSAEASAAPTPEAGATEASTVGPVAQ